MSGKVADVIGGGNALVDEAELEDELDDDDEEEDDENIVLLLFRASFKITSIFILKNLHFSLRPRGWNYNYGYRL